MPSRPAQISAAFHKRYDYKGNGLLRGHLMVKFGCLNRFLCPLRSVEMTVWVIRSVEMTMQSRNL